MDVMSGENLRKLNAACLWKKAMNSSGLFTALDDMMILMVYNAG